MSFWFSSSVCFSARLVRHFNSPAPCPREAHAAKWWGCGAASSALWVQLLCVQASDAVSLLLVCRKVREQSIIKREEEMRGQTWHLTANSLRSWPEGSDWLYSFASTSRWKVQHLYSWAWKGNACMWDLFFPCRLVAICGLICAFKNTKPQRGSHRVPSLCVGQ